MSTIKITILGCGSSGGVPRVGFGWGDCDPNEPRNRRRRCALLVERMADHGGRTAVLIDAGPDLRDQLLSVNCHHLDAVLLTMIMPIMSMGLMIARHCFAQSYAPERLYGYTNRHRSFQPFRLCFSCG